MTEVRKDVTLHPETVAKAETLAKEATKKRRAAKAKAKAKTPEPAVIRRYRKRPPWMNVEVWNTALKLAGGNHKRVILNSPTEALVENERH